MNPMEKTVVELHERQKGSEVRLEKIENAFADHVEEDHNRSMAWEKRYNEMAGMVSKNTDHISILIKVSLIVLTLSLGHLVSAIFSHVFRPDSMKPAIEQTRSN